MATQTRVRNCEKRRFEMIVEQTAKTFREIPANIFVRQELTKDANFFELFFDPAMVEFQSTFAQINRHGLAFARRRLRSPCGTQALASRTRRLSIFISHL
jgi:hypothetical protein